MQDACSFHPYREAKPFKSLDFNYNFSKQLVAYRLVQIRSILYVYFGGVRYNEASTGLKNAGKVWILSSK
jgi:hypothetical protein